MVKRKVSSLAVVVFALGCLASPTAWGQSAYCEAYCQHPGYVCTDNTCVKVRSTSDSEKEADLHSHYEKDAQESH